MNYPELILYLIAFAINTSATVAICRVRTGGWTRRMVISLWVVISAYLFTNYLSLNPPMRDVHTQLFWIRSVMAVTSYVLPVLVGLAAALPGRELSLRPWHVVALLLISTLSSVISWTPLVFESLTYVKGIETPITGPGIVLYAFVILASYVLSVIISTRRYRQAGLNERSAHLYYIIGLSASYALIITASAITTIILESSRTVFLGPVMFSILFVFLYSMLSDPERPTASA